MKHPAPAEGEVEVVEVDERLGNGGSRSNDGEEGVCTNDVNCNEDFVDQAADDPDVVDQQLEDENQSNGFSYEEEPARNADAISNKDHDDAVDELVELEGPAQESGHHAEVENRCSQCGKGFSKVKGLAQHMKNIHGPKKKCKVCQKLFSAVSLKRHMGHFPQDGENEQNLSFFSFFLKLHCDQTV